MQYSTCENSNKEVPSMLINRSDKLNPLYGFSLLLDSREIATPTNVKANLIKEPSSLWVNVTWNYPDTPGVLFTVGEGALQSNKGVFHKTCHQ